MGLVLSGSLAISLFPCLVVAQQRRRRLILGTRSVGEVVWVCRGDFFFRTVIPSNSGYRAHPAQSLGFLSEFLSREPSHPGCPPWLGHDKPQALTQIARSSSNQSHSLLYRANMTDILRPGAAAAASSLPRPHAPQTHPNPEDRP